MEENKKKSLFAVGLVEVAIVGIVIIVILTVLYFFNALPFKPSSSSKTNTITTSTTPTPVDESGYGCVLDGVLCKKAENIEVKYKDSPSFFALGYTGLKEGTPIKASISGTVGIGITLDPDTDRKIAWISIVSTDGKTEVGYRYIGKQFQPSPASAGKVQKGEVIGWIGDAPLKLNLNSKLYNLILTVQDKLSKNYVDIKTSDLK